MPDYRARPQLPPILPSLSPEEATRIEDVVRKHDAGSYKAFRREVWDELHGRAEIPEEDRIGDAYPSDSDYERYRETRRLADEL